MYQKNKCYLIEVIKQKSCEISSIRQLCTLIVLLLSRKSLGYIICKIHYCLRSAKELALTNSIVYPKNPLNFAFNLLNFGPGLLLKHDSGISFLSSCIY